ncbi:hypothetical protein NQ317_018688 [Molorchus minor]|uniref:BESS domain-containing protein n=1 Tax=Molorchus minor TaxID=1323400 RepID=A0ABQ9J399_9CUCU|nr:hypothetical protein NQ317_018688 [Molorchus minor]
MQSRRHEGNYDDGGEGTSTDGTREEEDSQNSIVEDYIAEEIPHNAKKKKGTKKDVPTQILDIMKQRKEQPIDDDDDTKFLLGFRSDMKAMNRIQKVNFKIGMLQLVKQISEPPRNVHSSLSSHSYNSRSPYSPSPQSPPHTNNTRSNIGRNTERALYTVMIPPNPGPNTIGSVSLYQPQPQPPSSALPPPPEHSGCADNIILHEFLQFRNI